MTGYSKKKFATTAMAIVMITLAAGCGTTSVGKSRTFSTAGNGTNDTNATNVTSTKTVSSGSASQTAPGSAAKVSGSVHNTATNSSSGAAPSTQSSLSDGWYYNNLSVFGPGAQIIGLQSSNGSLDVEAEYGVTQGNIIQPKYRSATLNLNRGSFGSTYPGVEPKGYNGAWTLQFGTLHYTKPIQISLAHHGTDVFTLPQSIPGYASEIMTDPAKFDNQVIGQSGPWVWIAMKGPQSPPIPQMTNGFRYWNRIVAINAQSHVFHVYTIPPNTASTSTGSHTPAFTQIGQTVYIGTGSWVGAFSSDPASNSSPIVRPEPRSVVSQDQQKMLDDLENEVKVGAEGLANYWNGYVMKGDQQKGQLVWEMDPAFWNHGNLPENIEWAVRFPLKQGSQAYKIRQTLFNEVEVLLKNPLDTAWIVLDTPEKMQSHFQSTPPAPIPGYIIKGEYYVKADTSAGSSTSQQTVYVFSQAMLEEIYAVEYFRSVGPIFPPQSIENEVNQWAPKVSMSMLPYAPADEQTLDKQLIQNIEGPMTLLKTLPGYTLHHDQLPSGTRIYWYPSNNKFPNWVNPALR